MTKHFLILTFGFLTLTAAYTNDARNHFQMVSNDASSSVFQRIAALCLWIQDDRDNKEALQEWNALHADINGKKFPLPARKNSSALLNRMREVDPLLGSKDTAFAQALFVLFLSETEAIFVAPGIAFNISESGLSRESKIIKEYYESGKSDTSEIGKVLQAAKDLRDEQPETNDDNPKKIPASGAKTPNEPLPKEDRETNEQISSAPDTNVAQPQDLEQPDNRADSTTPAQTGYSTGTLIAGGLVIACTLAVITAAVVYRKAITKKVKTLLLGSDLEALAIELRTLQIKYEHSDQQSTEHAKIKRDMDCLLENLPPHDAVEVLDLVERIKAIEMHTSY